MGKLINIDNGGTLTDICVIDGDRVHHTKTITTPYDLSRCFIDGLKKASVLVFGQEDLAALLHETDSIRYSTTQGTNALVERKGPRIGLITDERTAAEAYQTTASEQAMFAALVGERHRQIGSAPSDAEYTKAVVDAVNAITSAGANRIVVSFSGPDYRAREARFSSEAMRMFPRHLLGAVPILYAGFLSGDVDTGRRTWTAMFNAFLHPAMERFLYNAEGLLRPYRMRSPLLIFGNGGLSGKVAKTTALRTYSSGPRGGLDAARQMARYYNLSRVLSFDVGGTTTDIGLIVDGVIDTRPRGAIEGIACSLPLANIVSVGVGGGSIFRVSNGQIVVGPDSVGGAPGPACFGLGGQLPTITDALLVIGLLDPATYFGGAMPLDVERARAVITEGVAMPLGLTVPAAVHAMLAAWAQAIGYALCAHSPVTSDMTLMAFGGGGPLSVLMVADAIGARRVLVPRLAAVFSAFGIGFSDIGHVSEAKLMVHDPDALAALATELRANSLRDMFSEGFGAEECEVSCSISVDDETTESEFDLLRLPANVTSASDVIVRVSASSSVHRPAFPKNIPAARSDVRAGAERTILDSAGAATVLPVVFVNDQCAGASGDGPAVLEEPYWTCHVPPGWRYEFTANRDIAFHRVS